MSDNVIKIYKKTGETPLDCINELKKNNPEYIYLPMTYAGRLDPLAEGVLLILVGNECHKKDEYLKLSKEYEITILFGFVTDTYDVMGKVKILPEYKAKSKEVFEMVWPSFLKNSARRSEDLLNTTFDEALVKILPQFTGRIKQSYPPYSSRPVNGKPLFMWARENKLDEIEIPTHNVQVDNIEIIGQDFIKGEVLLKEIKDKIFKVKGDFRQKEIISIWKNELENKSDILYPLIKLKISCGSGVYMRSIANDIGERLGVPALALKIVRTKIGDYSI